MNGAEARQLLAYGSWANALFVRVAEGLTQEQLEARARTTVGSWLLSYGSRCLHKRAQRSEERFR